MAGATVLMAIGNCGSICPVFAAEIESGEKVYKSTLRSTVWVVVPQGNGKASSGTGSLVDVKRRLVLTNYHVVRERDEVRVFFPIMNKNGKVVAERQAYLDSGARIKGTVIAKEPKHDLALIRLDMVPNDARAIPLAGDSPSPGQRLHSIGNPGASGALFLYTQGNVRQVYQKKFIAADGKGDNGFTIDAQIVETQSPVNAGDSGGPVVNDRGELVAVTQGHLNDTQARLVSIFIDVSEVRKLMAKTLKIALPPPTVVKADTPLENTKEENPEDPAAKAEKEASRKLKFAKQFIEDAQVPGQEKFLTNARKHLNEIIETYPKTKAAAEAKELLAKIKK
jgi:S1-C subfamily serine protease